MAEINVEAALKNDEIPNDEVVLSKIKADPTGAIFEKVKTNYSKYKAQQATPIPPSQAKPAPEEAPKPVFRSWKDREKEINNAVQVNPELQNPNKLTPDTVPNPDLILQQKIKTYKIPDDPVVLDKIRRGEISIARVEQNYADYRAKNPIVKISPDGTINPAPAMKSWQPYKMNEAEQKMWSEFEKNRYIDPRIPKISPQGQPYTESERWGLSNELLNSESENKKLIKYSQNLVPNLTEHAMSGMTFGIYEPKIDEPPELDKITGTITNMAGSALPGYGIGAVFSKLPLLGSLASKSETLGEAINYLKNAKIVSKVLGEGGEELSKISGALFKKRIAKTALDVTRLNVESGTTGFLVGATKSAIQNNPPDEVLKDGITEGALYATFSNILYPLVGGAGKAFSFGKERRQANVLRAVANEPDVQQLASEVQGSGFLKNLKEKAPESRIETLASDALKKIEGIQPLVGTKAALIANPEILQAAQQDQARTLSKQLFGENGPLKGLMDVTPELRNLVETGKHLDALDSTQAAITDYLKKNPDAKEYITAPFLTNSKILNKVYSNRILSTVNNPSQYPNLQSNLLNYLEQPSAENALALKQEAPRKFFQKIQSQKFRDPRLNNREIDTMVGDILQEALTTVSGEGAGKAAGLFGKFKTTDDILKTAVTFNKELGRTFIQSYSQAPEFFEDGFLKASPDLMQGIRDSINLRRIFLERNSTISKRRELSLAMTDLNQKALNISDPEQLSQIKTQLAALKDKSQTLTSVLGRQNTDIRKINSTIQSLSAEQQQQINDFVAQVYMPKRAGLPYGQALEKRVAAQEEIGQARSTLAQVRSGEIQDPTGDLRDRMLKQVQEARQKYRNDMGVEPAQTYLKRFGAGENPYFVKSDSELADMMHAFVVSGQDIKSDLGKGFGILENPRRQLNRELGHNNVVEKFLDKVTDRLASIEDNMKLWSQKIDAIGIKPGTKDSALLQRLGEGRLKVTDEEFMNLSPKTQDKLIKGQTIARNFYDQILDTVNTVMQQNGLPEIKKRSDYFFHFNETMHGLPNKIINFMRGAGDEVEFGGKGAKMFWKPTFESDPNRTVFRSERARKGGEFIDDAITGMRAYLKPALERIFLTDLVREVDAARHFAPEKLGNFLQGIKDNYLLRAPNPVDETWVSGNMKKALNLYRERLGKGAILFNANTAFQNLLSTTQNFAISPMHGLKATVMMGTKQGREIAALSRNLRVRDAMHLEVDTEANIFKKSVLSKVPGGEGILNTAKTVGDAFEKIGGFALQTFDRMAAKHAFLTGYSKGKAMGLNQEQAVRFADKYTDMLQNNTSRLGQGQLYQSALAKSLFQFSSFVNNYATTIANDLPNIARTDGAAKGVQMIIRSVAGMSIANEMAKTVGAPAPFDLDTFIPFMGNFRYGTPGLFGAMYKGVEAVIGDEQRSGKAQKDLGRVGASLAIPGGGQAFKTYSAITDKKNLNDELSGYIFGKRKRKDYEQMIKERKSFLGRTRQMIKEEL